MARTRPMISLARRVTPWATPGNTPWREARFSVVDIETTGLSVKDEIVSVGVAEVLHGRLTANTFYEVARPSRPISADSMCIHGLTRDDLADAPPFAEVLPRFRATVANSMIVAHAAWVERAFLNRALKPLRERVPDALVDTAALARHAGLAPAGAGEPALEALARRLGLPVHTPHHALGDATTTAEVLLVLATRLEQTRGRVTVADLVELSAAHGN